MTKSSFGSLHRSMKLRLVISTLTYIIIIRSSDDSYSYEKQELAYILICQYLLSVTSYHSYFYFVNEVS